MATAPDKYCLHAVFQVTKTPLCDRPPVTDRVDLGTKTQLYWDYLPVQSIRGLFYAVDAHFMEFLYPLLCGNKNRLNRKWGFCDLFYHLAGCQLFNDWWLKVISYLRHILSLWVLSGHINPTMLQTIFYKEGRWWVQKPNFVDNIGLTSLFLTLFYAVEAILWSFCTLCYVGLITQRTESGVFVPVVLDAEIVPSLM